MYIDKPEKSYMVYVSHGDITVIEIGTSTLEYNLDGNTSIRAETIRSSPIHFKRNKIYMPITEEEIAELFIESNEELIKEWYLWITKL